MTIAEREQQILRVKEQSFQPELEEALEQKLREGVLEPTFRRCFLIFRNYP